MVIAEQVWHSENAALGCGLVFFVVVVHQAVFYMVHASLLQAEEKQQLQALSTSILVCIGKTAVVEVAATLNKEACMAIAVQLQDLPKALFSSCHSFLWTFAFCRLVADRGWIWSWPLRWMKWNRQGCFTIRPVRAEAAITQPAFSLN